MSSLDTLEPFGAAGKEGLLPGSILGGSRASHCQGSMLGGIPTPVTFPGREERGGMLFAGRVPEVLKLPVTIFWKGKQDVVEPQEQWECGGIRG